MTPPAPSRHTAPVFIGGDGRSGTTLLSLMLNAHPDLAIGPELHFRAPDNLGPYILECLDELELALETPQALKGRAHLRHGINFIHRCHRFGIEPSELRMLTRTTMTACGTSLESFDDRCALINLLGSTMETRCDAGCWGIKIMRDIRVAQWYSTLWPRSRFIHIVRDGRDVAASQLRDQQWGYSSVDDAAQGWITLLDSVERLRPTIELMEIRYEDLVLNPEHVMKRILKFLAAPWSERVLHHHVHDHALFAHPHDHPSINEVRQPINADAIGRYRNDLSSHECARFEQLAGRHLWKHRYLQHRRRACAQGQPIHSAGALP